jgi:hypothetical protein
MTANELRIGNLVLDGKNRIVEVDSITELGINIEHDSLTLFFEPFNPFGDEDNNDVIKPIPLTEEWLLKFGFECVYTLDRSFQHLDCEYDLEYVHQLQNLYFALTGEELTIKDTANG